MKNLQASILCDGYKTSHPKQFPQGTSFVHSNLTARSSNYATVPSSIHEGKTVFYGASYLVQKYFIEYFNENFFNIPEDDAVSYFETQMSSYLGPDNNVGSDHVRELHRHQKLPIRLKCLPEGTRVPIQVPMLIVENIGDEFFWVTNFLETIISTTMWMPITSATTSHGYRTLLESYAEKTGGSKDFIPFQGHDFSFRGMAGLEAAMMSGSAHLTSFLGTDTIPAIAFHQEYYNGNECDVIGVSVPASEHATMCTNIENIREGLESKGEWNGYKIEDISDEDSHNFQLMAEKIMIKEMINKIYPSGIVSLVSDSFDYWSVINKVIPSLKDDIIARDGKVVIRPDSGNPVDIVCGHEITDFTGRAKSVEDLKDWCEDFLSDVAMENQEHGEAGDYEVSGLFKYNETFYKATIEPFWNRHDKTYYYFDGIENSKIEEYLPSSEEKGSVQCLWDIFGGTVNDKGYKTLDPHIGLIYGDSINFENCQSILKGLEAKGFSCENITFGYGSYGFGYVTRDTWGQAIKATFSIVDGNPRNICKDPKTGSGKKSAKGLLAVLKDENGELYLRQEVPYEEYINGVEGDQMETVFEDGVHLIKPTLKEIRERLWG